MPAISALTDPTVLDFVTGQKLTAVQLESDSGNLRTAIVDLNDVVADLEDNYASSSEPTDKPEGKIFCDTTSDPAVFKGYVDGSGTLKTFLNEVENGGVWPSFRAYLGTQQDNITGADQVEFDSEDFDTNSDFDKDTNFRFTPTVAGKYLLVAAISWVTATIVASDQLKILITKNGSSVARIAYEADNTNEEGMQVVTIEDANGTTDFFEVAAENAARDTSDLNDGSALTFFSGSRIA